MKRVIDADGNAVDRDPVFRPVFGAGGVVGHQPEILADYVPDEPPFVGPGGLIGQDPGHDQPRFCMLTREPAGMLFVMKAFAPMTEPSPITVSPPRIDAPA